MRFRRVIMLLIPILAFAQEFDFQQEPEGIPVVDGEYSIPSPWTGGYSNSQPVLCDIDGDSDKDFFVGHWSEGHIAYFENTGTVYSPSFRLTEEVFQGIYIDEASATPYFVDIDSDGDLDLFVDWWNVMMKFYRNDGNPNVPLFTLAADIVYDNEGNYIDGTDFCLADIDADGDEDMFVGVWYSGRIKFYENVGDSTQYEFQLVDTTFANVLTGYWSSPAFCDLNGDGSLDLIVGQENGELDYYVNSGTPQVPVFGPPVEGWLEIDVGDRSAPYFCDIDGDADYDLFIGKQNHPGTPTPPGAIHYWENIGTPLEPDFIEITQNYLTFDAGKVNYVNLCDIDNDGDLDFFFTPTNFLGWMENLGSYNSPHFSIQSFDLIGYHSPFSCDLTDINDDGNPDLITADAYSGILTFYQNIGLPGNPEFQEIDEINTAYVIGNVTLADMDADGDKDLLLGGWENYPQGNVMVYYENQGTAERPDFVFITQDYLGLSSINIYALHPNLTDTDLDGDYDILFMNPSTSKVWYWENVGTPQQAVMDSITDDFLGYDFEVPIFVDLCDIDGDEDMDVFGGTGDGGVRFLRNLENNAVQPPVLLHPLHGIELTFGPNPANPITWVTFNLPYPQKAELAVYNLLGQKVATLASGHQMPGTRTYFWNATGTSSGTYFIRLETELSESTHKVTVVK